MWKISGIGVQKENKIMTEQEIIQNAEKYACPENSSIFNLEKERVMTHFIAGAHSRDEEINLLRDTLQSEQEQSQEHIIELQKELNIHRNQWISAKERLPKKKDGKIRSDVVLVTIGQYWTMAEYHFGDKRWINLIDKREIIEPEYWQEVNLPEEVLEIEE